jgi:hypothetical protein
MIYEHCKNRKSLFINVTVIKDAKDNEAKYKKQLGKTVREVTSKVLNILSKHYIEKPFYHGGKYNGKAMVKLMDYSNSEKMFDSIQTYLLSLPVSSRCSNSEIIQWIHKFKKILSVFDGVFSVARKPSGTVTSEDQIAQLQASITTAMTLWQGLGLSLAPKPHAMEDHLVEQIRQFKGIGDLCEDFVEKSHQDGIIDHARTRDSLSEEDKAKQHSCREHKRLLPSVVTQLKEVQRKLKRYKRVVDDNGINSQILVSKEEEKKQKK